ncbi:YihY/virulence factor BrkB family protein [Chromohalobacter sp. TMW 2.2299]|uniref:YihY/virulence factor BrkB family protein n=1 Tax=Chromohalobacter moromii TaxID=2860329 RepID=A0A9X2X4S7_9GAMM|nr:YihY/virulence factor BrkB family protein [Chromohalobacter japonicus]MCK0753791.1 YihY/virulence factor BrkB family protein [Chromohalobacter japonicus]MCK2046946.1 YihY/virulence factor BrkB family protein [Chromohalobacter moromii]MCT8506523.1 YihY/virulence factor BrkB family protein [Chromohalobacter moromii]
MSVINLSPRYWYRIVVNAATLWLEHNAFSFAGSLAFYTLFSLAPTIIIAVTVIGLVLGEDAAQGQIVAQLQDTMGQDAAMAIQQAVAQSRIESSGILPTLLGIGALVVGATTVFAQMQFSLNTLWGVTARPDRNGLWLFIKKRLLSLTVVLAVGFILMVSLVLSVMLRAFFRYASDWLPGVNALLGSAEFLVSLAVIALFFAAIFKVLPDVVVSWRDVMVGAIVTAVLFAIGRYAIAAYLAYTATASTYGAAGSVVLVLLWVYYSSLILLYGAAFTRTHLEARGKRIVPRNSAVSVKREFVDSPEYSATQATSASKGEGHA